MFNNKEDDRDNLKFLLTASPEVLLDWYKNAEHDDIVYAFELLEELQIDIDKELIKRNFNFVGHGTLATTLH